MPDGSWSESSQVHDDLDSPRVSFERICVVATVDVFHVIIAYLQVFVVYLLIFVVFLQIFVGCWGWFFGDLQLVS